VTKLVEYLPVKERAGLVREVLKTEFPGIRFIVKSEKVGSGDTIQVLWEAGPSKGALCKSLSNAALSYAEQDIYLWNNRNRLISLVRVIPEVVVEEKMVALEMLFAKSGKTLERSALITEAVKICESMSIGADAKQSVLVV
jgi:hypothetical protein